MSEIYRKIIFKNAFFACLKDSVTQGKITQEMKVVLICVFSKNRSDSISGFLSLEILVKKFRKTEKKSNCQIWGAFKRQKRSITRGSSEEKDLKCFQLFYILMLEKSLLKIKKIKLIYRKKRRVKLYI